MEMLNETLLVMGTPFLVQVLFSGGPPLVSPVRVKDGEAATNEDDVILTTGLVITPCTEEIEHVYDYIDNCLIQVF